MHMVESARACLKNAEFILELVSSFFVSWTIGTTIKLKHIYLVRIQPVIYPYLY